MTSPALTVPASSRGRQMLGKVPENTHFFSVIKIFAAP
jgi:hypothetical protein